MKIIHVIYHVSFIELWFCKSGKIFVSAIYISSAQNYSNFYILGQAVSSTQPPPKSPAHMQSQQQQQWTVSEAGLSTTIKNRGCCNFDSYMFYQCLEELWSFGLGKQASLRRQKKYVGACTVVMHGCQDSSVWVFRRCRFRTSEPSSDNLMSAGMR